MMATDAYIKVNKAKALIMFLVSEKRMYILLNLNRCIPFPCKV